MLKFDKLDLRFSPFPYSIIDDILDVKVYDEMNSSFPRLDDMKHRPELGEKWSVTCRRGDKKAMRKILRQSEVWYSFDAYVRSPAFRSDLEQKLARAGLEIYTYPSSFQRVLWRVGRALGIKKRFRINWEFSVMPGNGGHILPHTDSPEKIITIVIYFPDNTEGSPWNSKWGGHTEILVPNAAQSPGAYNLVNRQGTRGDFAVVECVEYRARSGMLFIKTHNSWHSVSPCTAPTGVFRRTVTLNIFRDL